LLAIYSFYLNKTQTKENNLFSCSPITKNVAEQASGLMHFFGYNSQIIQHDKELSMKVFVNDKFVARVIEGCNSVSVIILFLAFIIAFQGSIKNTIWFGLLGSALIYFVNLIRIGILSVGLYKYPKQEKLLHDLIFPAIVYGMVFLLWIIWVNKFSNYAKK
jgi:exosortase family protein XrtF